MNADLEDSNSLYIKGNIRPYNIKTSLRASQACALCVCVSTTDIINRACSRSFRVKLGMTLYISDHSDFHALSVSLHYTLIQFCVLRCVLNCFYEWLCP